MIDLNNTTIGLLSDVHIGNYRDDPKWHERALDVAKWCAREYKARGITDIIIAGDVFHHRHEISVKTLEAARMFFEQLREFNIIVTIGNHDAYYRDRSDVNSLNSFAHWDNIHVVSDLTMIEIAGKRIALCPWAIECDQIPECDIIIGHFEFAGFQIAHQKVCQTGIPSAQILAKAPLVISGHFHMAAERKYEKGIIKYLGTPYQLNWGEAGDRKYIYTLDIRTNEFVQIINTHSPQHLRVKMSDWENRTPLDGLQGHIINAVVDVGIDATDPRVAAFIADIQCEIPAEIKVTHSTVSMDRSTGQFEFDGVDVMSAISEFVNKLNLADTLKHDVLLRTVELYNQHT